MDESLDFLELLPTRQRVQWLTCSLSDLKRVRLAWRDRALCDAASFYDGLCVSAKAQLIARDLVRLQPIVMRTNAEDDGDGKRGALALFLRLNLFQCLGPEQIANILTGQRTRR
jgi:hypothetical protein